MTNLVKLTESLANRLEILKEQAKKTSGDLIVEADGLDFTAFILTRDKTFKTIKSRVWQRARNAATRSGEFAGQEFLLRLKKAIYESGAYRFTPDSNYKLLKLEINLEETAGSIRDYFDAVEAVRDELGVKKDNPLRASGYWEMMYKGIKPGWKETVKARVGYYTTLAPFWQLLNDGNVGFVEYGYGGYPTPTYGPSNFIEKSEASAKIYFDNELEVMKKRLLYEIQAADYGLRPFLDNFGRVFSGGTPIRNISGDVKRASRTLRQIVSEFIGKEKEAFESGEVLGSFKIGSQGYEVYITEKQKNLGLRMGR